MTGSIGDTFTIRDSFGFSHPAPCFLVLAPCPLPLAPCPLLLAQRLDPRQSSFREELQRCSSTGRYVSELLGDAGGMNGGDALAAPHDRHGVRVREQQRERAGRAVERWMLEY